MRTLVLMLCAAVFTLSACAHKGGLKTPSQAAADEAKKQRQEEKKAREGKQNAVVQ